MGVTTLRPTALYSDSAGVTNIGGGSLNDDSDATYKIIAVPGWTKQYMGDIGGIDGVSRRVYRVRPGARWSRYNGDFTIDSRIWWVEPDHWTRQAAFLGGSGHGVFMTWGSWFEDTSLGAEITQDYVNNSFGYFNDQGGGSTGPIIYEMYAEVEWRDRPVVSAVGPSGTNPGATRTPTITWNYTDPDGIDGESAYRVKIFTSAQGDPDNATGAVYDSGDVGGPATSQVTSSLNDGNYYCYVKVAKWFRNFQWWSTWGSTTFTISFPPGVPSALQRTGATNDATPNFSAFVNEPGGQQVKGRFELYQNDGTTLIASMDSSYVTGSGTVSVEYATSLALGSYKVRVQSVDIDGLTSAWTSLVSFDVTQTVSADSILLWNIMQTVLSDVVLLWDIQANNTTDLILLWDVFTTNFGDLILKWNVETPWILVSEPASVWAEAVEL